MKTYVERLEAGQVGAAIEKAKRLERQGWRIALLENIGTGSVVVLGVLEAGATVRPDRTGQFELELEA